MGNQSDIIVRRATAEEAPRIASMLRGYLSEMGVGEEYPYLHLYWVESGRFPYLVLLRDEIIGFALVRRLARDGTFSMAEFYIRPDQRKSGAGRVAATTVIESHPGNWMVSALPHNVAAQKFWHRIIPFIQVRPMTTEIEESGRIIFHFGVGAQPE